MERNFKLNLEPIRNRLGLTRAELAARTGLRADRIGVLEKNKFEQLSVEELDALFRFAAPGELFSAWERSVFYGARQSGRLKVFIPLHSVPVAGGEESLYSSVYDEEARDVVEHAVSRGIAVESVRLRPRPPTEEVANEIEKLVPQGSVVSLGSQLTSDFNEIAMALMFEATPFEVRDRAKIPLHFVFGADRAPRKSAFGFSSTQMEPGIYTQAGKMVARHQHVLAGEGEDCAMVVAYRIPEGRSDDGMTRERCVVLAMGLSGPGTVVAARALARPDLAPEFVPPGYWQPRTRVLRATYVRLASPLSPTFDNREIRGFELVPESEAGGVTHLPSRLNPKKEEQ